MKNILYFFLLLSCLSVSLPAYNFTPEQTKQGTPLQLVKNEGQWNDTIQFKTGLTNGSLFLTNHGFVYHFVDNSDMNRWHDELSGIKKFRTEEKSFRHHAYKVNFIDAQTDSIYYEANGRLSWYHNYFLGNDSSKWRSQVPIYQKVTQRKVYPGVDLVLYKDDDGLKYDFIVAPGADPGQIILEYEGVQPRLTKEGDLEIVTTVNKVIEKAPLVYQQYGDGKVIIPSHYKLKGNQLTFEIGNYDHRFPLVIDPTLVFATFSGSDNGAASLGFSSTFDNQGNMYAGAMNNQPGWPTSIGAYQEASAGSQDIGINKYNASGTTLMFSTYLGGGNSERPNAMLVNEDGNLIIAGKTNSPDFPTTSNCFDTTFNSVVPVWGLSESDFFVTILSEDGATLRASTFVGSSWDEYTTPFSMDYPGSVLEIALGDDETIWIASAISNTGNATTPFPTTPNAIQREYGGGASDAILFQMNSNLSELLYASYLGGDLADAAFSLKMNSEGKVIVCGVTSSLNFPTTSNVMHSVYVGGESDGFVFIMDPTNYSVIASSFLGTAETDAALKLEIDEHDNILVLGQTMGDYPISPSVYHLPGTDHFMDKVTADLTGSILSTRLGVPQGSEERFETASFLYDQCGRTYVTGFKGSPDLPTTLDAIQTTGGVWMGILETDFRGLHYATYFGTPGDHFHDGVNRLDPKGVVYQTICGAGYANQYYPTTSNAAFPQKTNGTGLDAISFKIDLEAEFVEAAATLPVSTNDSGCVPYTVTFTNNTYSPFPVEYAWDFGDGSPLDTGASPTHTFTAPGVYQVVLTATSPLSCNIEDTDTLVISVFQTEGPAIFTSDTTICQHEEALELSVYIPNLQPSHAIEWGPFHAILTDRYNDSVTVDPNLSNLFWVQVQDTAKFCAVSFDTITVDYPDRSLNIITPDTLLCLGDTLQVTAIGGDGYSYRWNPPDRVSDSSSLNPYIIAKSTATYTLTGHHPVCNDTSGSFVLRVDSPVNLSYYAEPREVCLGSPIYLYPSFSEMETTLTGISWNFGEQIRTEASPSYSYQHAFYRAGRYPVTLHAQFRACPDTSYTDSITVYPLPDVDLGADSLICLHGAPIYLKNLREAPLTPYHQVWSAGDTTDVLKVVHPGTYTLTVTSEPIGCTTTESIEIKKGCYLDIPNAFTPNGDGHNDFFFPRRLLSEGVSRFNMQVFNRWGQLIFETINPDGRGWDGRFSDKDQPTGVYLYRIEANFNNGYQEQYEGNVTLIR